MKKYLLFYIIALFFFTACNEEFDDFTLERGEFFYPLEVGMNMTYQVDSTIYDPFELEIREKTVYIREFIESTYLDDAGNTNYRIERYTGNTPEDVNRLLNVWYTSVTPRAVERVENNLRFRKMIFPVIQGARWNAHTFLVPDPALSFLLNWRYSYHRLNLPFTLDAEDAFQQDFDTTVTVRQFGDSTNIIQTRGREVYAKDIGLIYREFTYLDGSSPCRRLCPSQTTECVSNCFTLPLSVRADNGVIVTFRLIKNEITL